MLTVIPQNIWRGNYETECGQVSAAASVNTQKRPYMNT